ncbi:MAG: hypothetical protein R2800_03310 [Flavipsychrobacter sp.]
MKKLENLNQSKFETFKDAKINNLHMVIGGLPMVKSSGTNPPRHDVAELTAGGANHDGVPGDGTADDWGETKWYPGFIDITKAVEHTHTGEIEELPSAGYVYDDTDAVSGNISSATY